MIVATIVVSIVVLAVNIVASASVIATTERGPMRAIENVHVGNLSIDEKLQFSGIDALHLLLSNRLALLGKTVGSGFFPRRKQDDTLLELWFPRPHEQN